MKSNPSLLELSFYSPRPPLTHTHPETHMLAGTHTPTISCHKEAEEQIEEQILLIKYF